MFTCTIDFLGTVVRFRADDERLPNLLSLFLPPSAFYGSDDLVKIEYTIAPNSNNNSYIGLRNHRQITTAPTFISVLQEVITDLQVMVARKIKDRVFIHAAVVALDGKAIILPGKSGVGKSTIASALIRSGAHYLSDEFALIDPLGMVHPYARNLAIKSPDFGVKRLSPEALGGVTFQGAAAPAAIVFSHYNPKGDNVLKTLSRSELILTILPHCLGIRSQVSETLSSLEALSKRAKGYFVERNEADEFARKLLDLLN